MVLGSEDYGLVGEFSITVISCFRGPGRFGIDVRR